ncbi:MAG: 23S rRNA (guanosine(2251)-2'-O)-methyltransferase RlmB [Deltaproteobacteria bacterium]|nr:MAG: 23S rRNA (guanosine(2251)-2'-O)-methyltransferase RlmB [Deltaproteobacteria bacterium]
MTNKRGPRRPPRRKPHEATPTEAEPSADASEEWAYGIHTLEEMLNSNDAAIDEIVIAGEAQGKLANLRQEAQKQGHFVRRRPKSYFNRLLGPVNHQGVAIKLRKFAFSELSDLLVDPEQKALLCLVGVQDPGNMGALVRSARAFGATGVIYTQRDSCGVNATVHKTSAGATSSLPIARVRNLSRAMEEMREAGWWLLGLAGEGQDEIDRFDLIRPTIFLLGTEGKGLPPSIRKQCDALLRIPMVPGWDSLNVAASGAIALYEWHRQRRKQEES